AQAVIFRYGPSETPGNAEPFIFSLTKGPGNRQAAIKFCRELLFQNPQIGRNSGSREQDGTGERECHLKAARSPCKKSSPLTL
ncbi:Hypothetical predicted protein, partial [Podarcis lilfordi]